jgi:hypothetical protein
MQMAWLGVAIAATVAYHVILKLTPAGANPYLSLAVTYTVVTTLFAITYVATSGPVAFRAAVGELNWTALALGAVVVFLDLGFFMLYRGGFDVSLGALTNIGGIVLCMAGFWLINKK